ncbi:NAD-dependent epimerase/dehydratase family protein [Egibacter rhizosphaerae]|uniref:NAD-dependent epimerase/dehydratase family protein n=1 Tax=Egibacter rhizosphaerae TaxID=1670831 RepID=A0A411YGA0_9ACTN|nr:NAD-dependent epimerase/dehydratase family protein [Egibacter rhizosphaerae]QBI20305.1 NAD-dependent epimerase/dehydratase family protein [Egibacter rhizosphaerae]
MDIAVTGGAGFIGANLVRYLRVADPGGHVRVLDDLSTGSKANLDGLDGVALHEGSVIDPAALDRALDGVDAVVHLAAHTSVPRSLADPKGAYAVNATGTVEVLEAARRHGDLHTIVASSSAVYGNGPALPKYEELPAEPRSPYAGSKLAAEGAAAAWQASFGLPTLAFRFFNVFGPLQPAGHAYAAVVPAFVEAALDRRPLEIHGDGHQTRDFIYVGSVVEALADALWRRVTSEGPVNVAFGARLSLLDVVEELREQLGELDVHHTAPREGDVRHSQADQRRFWELFPDIEPVPFDRGLAATVRWFRTGEVPRHR